MFLEKYRNKKQKHEAHKKDTLERVKGLIAEAAVEQDPAKQLQLYVRAEFGAEAWRESGLRRVEKNSEKAGQVTFLGFQGTSLLFAIPAMAAIGMAGIAVFIGGMLAGAYAAHKVRNRKDLEDADYLAELAALKKDAYNKIESIMDSKWGELVQSGAMKNLSDNYSTIRGIFNHKAGEKTLVAAQTHAANVEKKKDSPWGTLPKGYKPPSV